MKKRVEGLLQHAIDRAMKGGRLKSTSLPPLFLEFPKDSRFGDLASTVALHLARQEHRSPRAIAEAIRDALEDPEELLSEVTIEGPGFLNLRFSQRFWSDCLAEVEHPEYGRMDLGDHHRVLLEYVSTNPTGPLHVGHGRGAVIGDVLARLLTAAGCEVTREYYVNDAGKQIDILARSMYARLLQVYGEDAPVPEDGYPGEYLLDLAREHRETLANDIARAAGVSLPTQHAIPLMLRQAGNGCLAVCGQRAAGWLLRIIKDDLRVLGIEFDNFVSEQQLRDEGVVEGGLRLLDERGLLYDEAGARWFRSTVFGDEKDRVVQRSDGELTYFASDIGYHRQKLARGFERLIDVWGADHHGYVARVKAAIEAAGGDPGALDVILVQMVRITRGGEPVRMGKRKGEFITMREVVDEVGPDAARFFFLMRKADSHLDFDLELAKKQSAENPVFYVQYAHARICSVFRQATREGFAVPAACNAHLECLGTPEDQEVVRLLARFPDIVEEATKVLEPHRIVFFLIEVAGAFHRFYNRHRILGSEPDQCSARLYLCAAVQRVLRSGLDLLGVRAPESM
jgi:arginyl-tRNA synthetase